MEQIKTVEGGKIVNYASIIENSTKDQAMKTAAMPFIYPHLALMPDAHLGKGATVGSVIPTVGAIIPAAVGVDIGCGMQAVLTQFTLEDIDLAAADRRLSRFEFLQGGLHAEIASRIPLSAGKYNHELTPSAQGRVWDLMAMPGSLQADEVSSNWQLQLGSLGSGNHFIEVSLDEQDRVWLFLHSGSRGVGNKLATKWIKVAKELMTKYFIPLPDPDLAYLVEGTEEFDAYMEALNWAQEFARLNREEMMDRVIIAFEDWIDEPVERLQEVQCHHNYTTREHHFGKNVWLSRKGAISAKTGELGLIPGSMGAASYVVEGLGNRLALDSSPHGAGRNHSRTAAKKLFTREDLNKRMAGVAWGNSDAFLDEHPLAYKDIDQVMVDAADLVRPVHTLRQIVNVKGAS
ncbi:MAG: RtcB family protein [Marmoricola sp.]|nr:RtcB family protein [Marmoricola sp.]